MKLFQLNFHEFQSKSNELIALVDVVKVKKNNKKDTKYIGSFTIFPGSTISEVAAEKLVQYTPIYALSIEIITSSKEKGVLIVYFSNLTEKNTFKAKLTAFLQSSIVPAVVGVEENTSVETPVVSNNDASLLEVDFADNDYVEDSVLDDTLGESITTASLHHSDDGDDDSVAPNRVALTSSFNMTSLLCNEPVRKISTLIPPLGVTSSILSNIPDFSQVSSNPFSPNPFVEASKSSDGTSPNPFTGFTPVNTNGIVGSHGPTSSHSKFNPVAASPITKISNDLVNESKTTAGPPSLARRHMPSAVPLHDTIGLPPPPPATSHFITASPVPIASTRINTSENTNSVTSRKIIEELENVKKLNEELNEMLERQELLRASETGELMEQVLVLTQEKEDLVCEIQSLKDALDSTSDALTEMAFVGDDHADRARNAEEELDLLRHRIRTLTANNNSKHISPTIQNAPAAAAASYQWNDFDDQDDVAPPSPPVVTNNLQLNHAILQRKELENTIVHLNNQLASVEEEVTSRIEAEVLKERTRLTKQLAFQETVNAQLQNDIISIKDSALKRNNELEQLLHEQRDLINELSGQLESITEVKRDNFQLKGANSTLSSSVTDLKVIQSSLEVELQAVKTELEHSNIELARIREEGLNNELKASEQTRGLRSEIHQLTDKIVNLTASERQLALTKANLDMLENELTSVRSKYQEKEIAHADEVTALTQQVNELKHALHETTSNAQTQQHKLNLSLKEVQVLQQELSSEKELRISDHARSNSEFQELTNKLAASNTSFANKVKHLQEEINNLSTQRAALEDASSNAKMQCDELMIKNSTIDFALKQSNQQVSALQEKIKQYDELIARINQEHEVSRDEKIATILALEKEINTQKLTHMTSLQSVESSHSAVKEEYEKLLMANKVDFDMISKVTILASHVKSTMETAHTTSEQEAHVETSVFKAPISSSTGKPCKKCIKEKGYCQFHLGSNASASVGDAVGDTKSTTDLLYSLLKDLSLIHAQIDPIRASTDRVVEVVSQIHSFLVATNSHSVSYIPTDSLAHTLAGVEQFMPIVFDAMKNEDSLRRLAETRVSDLSSELDTRQQRFVTELNELQQRLSSDLDTRQQRFVTELNELQQRYDEVKVVKEAAELRYSHEVKVLQEELNAYMKESDKLQDSYQKELVQVTKATEDKYSRLMEEYTAQCEHRLEDEASRLNQLIEVKVNDFAVKEVAMAEEIEKLLRDKKNMVEKMQECTSSLHDKTRLTEKLSKELSNVSGKYGELKDQYDKIELKLASETRAKLECERALRRFAPALTSASLHDTSMTSRSTPVASKLDVHSKRVKETSFIMQNQLNNSTDQLNFSDISLMDVANEDVAASLSPFRTNDIEPIADHSLLSSVMVMNTSSTTKGQSKSAQDWASIRRQKVEKAMQDRGWLKK